MTKPKSERAKVVAQLLSQVLCVEWGYNWFEASHSEKASFMNGAKILIRRMTEVGLLVTLKPRKASKK